MAKAPQKPDGFEMFCYASEYISAAEMLGVMAEQIKEQRTAGFMAATENGTWCEQLVLISAHVPGSVAAHVLTALSLEIHLKCLHRVRGRMPPRGHDLKRICEALSLKDLRELNRRFSGRNKVVGFVDESTGKTRHMSLESALIRASAYFTDIRYGYEMPSPRAPSSGNPFDARGDLGISWAIASVREMILAKRPEWESQYLSVRSLD